MTKNTAFRRELLPLMYLPAHVNFRLTDILRGYMAQPVLRAAGYRLGFAGPTVGQARNAHDQQAAFASALPLYTGAERIMAVVREGVRASASISHNLYTVYANLTRAALVLEKERDLLTFWLEDTAALEAT